MESQRKTRRQFSKQFKAETVALICTSGKSVPQVCRNLDLAESVVRRWLTQATSLGRDDLVNSLRTYGAPGVHADFAGLARASVRSESLD